MYHTQERRNDKLANPVICYRDDAWLGEGYYFWNDIGDAHKWGIKSKRKTGYYEIYEALIDCENVLDTVFNEEHYLFWLKQVEKAAKQIKLKTGIKPNIKELNDFFKEWGNWDEVDGILFQDLPTSQKYLLVESFYYKKRIQIAVYTLGIVSDFKFLIEEKC